MKRKILMATPLALLAAGIAYAMVPYPFQEVFKGERTVYYFTGANEFISSDTAVFCTNLKADKNGDSASIRVQMYKENGILAGEASTTILPGQSKLFTSDADGVGLNIGGAFFGYVRVIADKKSRKSIFCTAFIYRDGDITNATMQLPAERVGRFRRPKDIIVSP